MASRAAWSPFVLPGERGPTRRQACWAFPENPMKSPKQQAEFSPIKRLGRPPGKTPPKTAAERMQAMRDRRKGKNEKRIEGRMPSIEMTTK